MRRTLSAILVLHPVAAVLTLAMCIMAATSHMHSAAHSSRYLLVMFIFTVITTLVCVAAFVIDILLFIPHLAWGSYIVLAATIMVAISAVVSCAMRRTIVGRKSRQKRIAENAEMSGENYYNREDRFKTAPTVSSEPTMPMVSGGNSGADSLPTFATFENRRKDDQVSDERIPLTQRSPVDRSPNTMPNDLASVGDAGSFNAVSRSQSRDRFGNPINGPQQDAYGVPRSQSFDRMNGRGRGGPGGPGSRGGRGGAGYGRGGFDAYGMPGGRGRGRGGYGAPGRGGPPRGRGGYGPPPRGGYGPGSMRGGRGPPPNGYANMPGAPYERRPSADEYPPYGSNNGSAANINRGFEAYAPENGDLPRAESPPPLPGQAMTGGSAIEMDGTPVDQPHGLGQYGQIRDSDVDVAGMVGLQQSRGAARHDTYMSEESKYSTDEYVPTNYRSMPNGTIMLTSDLSAGNITSLHAQRGIKTAETPREPHLPPTHCDMELVVREETLP